MQKRLPALCLCLVMCLMLLASCGGTNNQSVPTDPETGNIALSMDFSVKEQGGVEFMFQSLPDSIYTMLYEPISGVNTGLVLGMCIGEDYDSDWINDTETASNYWVYRSEDKESVATVTVQNAPVDPKAHYGVATDEEAAKKMEAEFFPAVKFQQGLKKNVEVDFGYDLVIDWTGTAYGLPVGYLEFVDPETNTHSMRMCISTETVDNTFYSYTVRADVPADDKEAIYDMRAMLFSTHPMDFYTVEDAGPELLEGVNIEGAVEGVDEK